MHKAVESATDSPKRSSSALRIFAFVIRAIGQVDELVGALDLIADENGRRNKSLQILQLEAKTRVVA
jgi:hypothetical protein